MISTTAPPATPDEMNHSGRTSTARALTLEPRRAVLRALRAMRAWARGQEVNAADLAALDRVLTTLAAAEAGPNLDLVMRAARRRVIVQARAGHTALVD